MILTVGEEKFKAFNAREEPRAEMGGINVRRLPSLIDVSVFVGVCVLHSCCAKSA